MMDKPDTSAEAVERLARLYDDAGLCRATSQHPSHAHTAATLRAMLAERDAAWKTERAATDAADEYEAERDAARDFSIWGMASGVLAVAFFIVAVVLS